MTFLVFLQLNLFFFFLCIELRALTQLIIHIKETKLWKRGKKKKISIHYRDQKENANDDMALLRLEKNSI